MHQKLGGPQGRPGRTVDGRGEAASQAVSDEATPARHEQTGCGADDLLGQALARENMARAWKRVKANKGSAGVDGRTVQETGEYLRTTWPDIRRRLLDGSYRPEPVRRVGIPKPGGGTRELGIPTVVDRLIQQALLQVLQPLIDPTFSEHSHGFRPGRSAHGAVLKAQQYVQAGLLAHGVHSERFEGTPQGGPVSPLLANVLLDEVDRELERRGHKFVRYADDCNVYVRSQRAGERVLQGLRDCYARLALKVNEAKTAVGPVWGRKFLGYCLMASPQGEVKRAVASQALDKLRDRIRQITSRSRGRSLEQMAEDLRCYVPGWKSYFRLAQTPSVMRNLDGWLRHRLRAVQLKQWKRGTTIFRELRKLGASVDQAANVAGGARQWWRTSGGAAHFVLTVAHFDRLGIPKFS